MASDGCSTLCDQGSVGGPSLVVTISAQLPSLSAVCPSACPSQAPTDCLQLLAAQAPGCGRGGTHRGGGSASCCPGSLPDRVRGTRHYPLEGPVGALFGSKTLERTALAWSGGTADGPGFPVSPGRLEDRGHCGIGPRCPVQPCLLHPVHCSPGHQPPPLLLPTAGRQATGSSWTFPISPQSLGAQLSFRIQPENPT